MRMLSNLTASIGMTGFHQMRVISDMEKFSVDITCLFSVYIFRTEEFIGWASSVTSYSVFFLSFFFFLSETITQARTVSGMFNKILCNYKWIKKKHCLILNKNVQIDR